MIICPKCHYSNPTGALFCAECGAQLQAEIVTQSFRTDRIAPFSDPSREMPVATALPQEAWASLHLLESGRILPLTDRNEYTLGRYTEGQPIVPDIELSPYQAYAAGVSRLHALIRREGKRVVVMDLGSSNGTYINGKRLPPRIEHLLNHGDIIALGKFKIQVLLK